MCTAPVAYAPVTSNVQHRGDAHLERHGSLRRVPDACPRTSRAASRSASRRAGANPHAVEGSRFTWADAAPDVASSLATRIAMSRLMGLPER